MVESETTTTGNDLNRLITFELDKGEFLLIRAGRDELDNRTILRQQTQGRYAVVPVSELQREADSGDHDVDLNLEGMQIVDSAVTIADDGDSMVGLHHAGEQLVRMDRAGAYGLLWIPAKTT